MKKRLILISALVLVAVLALFAFTACNNASSEVGTELVADGAFSDWVDEENNNHFASWSVPSDLQGEYSRSPKDGDTSDYALRISNGSTNKYSYVYQRVKVDINKIYKVSVDIKVESELNRDNGAYITFLENTGYVFAGQRSATNGYVTRTFYVRPKNTDYLTIALCLGTNQLGCTGSVFFDNVSVQRVEAESVPEDVEIVNFRKVRTVQSAEDVRGICFVVLLTLFSIVAMIAFYIIIRRIYGRRNAFGNIGEQVNAYATGSATKIKSGKWYHNSIFIVCMLALATFAIRLVLLMTMYGTASDLTMNNLLTAAESLSAKNGVWTYLQNNPSSTFSPGSMYILAIIGAATRDLTNASASILLRFINVLADMAVVALIYFYGKKRVGNKLSTVYAAMYAVLPFVFAMSGINGTFESLLVLLLLVSVILMINKQYLATYLTMTLAAVLDLRALAIAPIVIAYFVYCYIKDNDDMRKFTSKRAQIIFGLVATIPLAYLLTLPVGINQIANGDPFFNFKVLANEMQGTTYFVNNAFNLYGMVAMNGKTLNQSVSILNLVFLLVLEAYVISLYFKNRNKQELILLVSFTLAMIAVFTVKVNYTYLFLSIVFALIYTMISGEKRMYGIVTGYTAIGFLGFAQLLNQSGLIASGATAAIVGYETTSPFYIIFCVLTVLLTGYYVYVTYSITNSSKLVDISGMSETFAVTVKKYFTGLANRFKSRDAN